ncbi:uncharacterized protein N7473_006600 [Penicillium subrubescens]|uniref:uncharacterized protein n=1 Tax=Penicillium subrubescens TaxID=1316194 RepID=UPI00254587A4|nr:uncharacterized protein N7473_006600 [Penicillium subrubescens]KAJ5890372.1 hypothetical protein N7473_006600 [Penicillium subrubescens]
MALAVSSVYALPQATEGPVCLRLCRDEPLTTCPSGWETAQIESDGRVRTISTAESLSVM